MRTSVCAISLRTNVPTQLCVINYQSRSLHFLNRNREVKASPSPLWRCALYCHAMSCHTLCHAKPRRDRVPQNSTRSDFRPKALPVPCSLQQQVLRSLIISTFRTSLPACDRPIGWLNRTALVTRCCGVKSPVAGAAHLSSRTPGSNFRVFCFFDYCSIGAWLLAHACVVLLRPRACASLTHSPSGLLTG